MNSRISIVLLLLPHLSCSFSHLDNVPNPNSCYFGVGKPPGNFLFQGGKIKSSNPPVAVHHGLTQRQCKLLCISNKNCWYIEVRLEDSKCLFYDNTSMLQQGRYVLHWWNPCDIPGDCKTLPHRCKGFWLLTEQSYLTGPRVIKTLSNIHDIRRCQSECLSIPVCESINVHGIEPDGSLTIGYCDILQFSSFNRTEIKDDSSMLFEWHCCPHNDEDISKICRNQHGKCQGVWQPKPSENLSVNGSIGQVITMSKFDCMSMCDTNPYCWSVYFNQHNATCVFLGENPNLISDCVKFDVANLNASHWFVYDWTCCDPKQDPIQPHPSDPDSLDARCVCLNATSVGKSLLATDGCRGQSHNWNRVQSIAVTSTALSSTRMPNALG